MHRVNDEEMNRMAKTEMEKNGWERREMGDWGGGQKERCMCALRVKEE